MHCVSSFTTTPNWLSFPCYAPHSINNGLLLELQLLVNRSLKTVEQILNNIFPQENSQLFSSHVWSHIKYLHFELSVGQTEYVRTSPWAPDICRVTWVCTVKRVQNTQGIFLLSGLIKHNTGDWDKQSHKAGYLLTQLTQSFLI